MTVALLLETDAGRWALDDDELRWLAHAVSERLIKEHAEAKRYADGKGQVKVELDPAWLERERLMQFLRNPEKPSCSCCY